MVIGRLIVLFALVCFSSFTIACETTLGYLHTNPDGSLGGFVSSFAKVGQGVIISPDAQVCDKAWVKSFVVLRDEAIVTGNAVLAGNMELPR